VEHRVRAVDAGAVVAIDVHAEDRVVQAGLVAVADLKRRGIADLEQRLRRAGFVDDLRGHDLDLARSGATADLAAQRALAQLALADLEVVRGRDVADRATRCDASLIEPDRAVAEALDETDVVRHEHDRLPRPAELGDLRVALVLEVLVTDGEHLVDEQHIGIDVHRDREAEPRRHAARVRLDRRVEEAAELREALDLRHRRLGLLTREAEQRAVEVRVLASGEVGVKARAELEERGHPSLDLDRAGRRLRGAGDELEERGLPRTVRADDAEAQSTVDAEAHVLQRVDDLSGRDLSEDELLERRGAPGPES